MISGAPPKKLEHAHVRADEVGELLRACRLRERVVARAEHPDEQLHCGDLARRRIGDVELLARVVDEDLLARAMNLAHRHREVLAPLRVERAEAAVLVRLRGRGLRSAVSVLEPECLEGDACPGELAVNPPKVDRDTCRRLGPIQAGEEQRGHLGVRQLTRHLPRERRGSRPPQVVVHRGLSDRRRRGDLRVAAPTLEAQP